MGQYSSEFDQIKTLLPKKRGFAFEAFLNKVLKNEKILIKESFRTDDGEQQIDGCLEIKGKIFLLEIKWERHETIAASKVFSFIGKVNSKIEGTLGIFISYNRLSDNTINSIRNGIRQNIIVIHGEDTIDKMITEDIKWKDYIWQTFQKASTEHAQYMDISEYTSKQDIEQGSDSGWPRIFSLMKDNAQTLDVFVAALDGLSGGYVQYSSKVLRVYPYLKDRMQIEKCNKYLTDVLQSNQQAVGIEIASVLIGDDWKNYCTETFSEKFIPKAIFSEDGLQQYIDKVLAYLDENSGSYDNEDLATYGIRPLFVRLNKKQKIFVLTKYIPIFIDSFRSSRYIKKQFAGEIFVESNADLIHEAALNYLNVNIDKEINVLKYFYENDSDDLVQKAKNRIREKLFPLERITGRSIIEAG